MNVSSRHLKLALWEVWKKCQDANPTISLRQALVDNGLASREAIAQGAVSQTSGNGHMVQFFSPGNSELTPASIAEAWVYLVEIFDISSTQLGGGTDAEIEAQMEVNLRTIKDTTSNWMYMAK